MLPEVTMIIFAVHAAIKLGQKIRTVFEDEVRDRDLTLPPVGFSPADLPFWDPEKSSHFSRRKARASWPRPPSRGQGRKLCPSPRRASISRFGSKGDQPGIQDQLCFAYQRIQETLRPPSQG